MVSSLAALRGRGGVALGSDRFLFVVGDHTSPSETLQLRDAMPEILANEVTSVLGRKIDRLDKMRRAS
jgi:hypothetical protein